MKLHVPYYSQFVDIQDPFWMLRACGGLCLKMVAEFHGVKVPDILGVCNEARERGGYDMQNGWVHDYIIKKSEEFGLTAHRTERVEPIIDEIIASLEAGNPVIVSVEKRVLEQTRFHMVVIVGYEKNEESELATIYQLQPTNCFYYHEPESTDKIKGAYRVCDVETFKQYWRGKAIFVTKAL